MPYQERHFLVSLLLPAGKRKDKKIKAAFAADAVNKSGFGEVSSSGMQYDRPGEWYGYLTDGHRVHVEEILENPTMQSASERAAKIRGFREETIAKRGLVPIYETVQEIIAVKGPGHKCDAACKRAGHTYKHVFSGSAGIFGSPDGKYLIIK